LSLSARKLDRVRKIYLCQSLNELVRKVSFVTCLIGVCSVLLAIFRHRSLKSKHVVFPVPLRPRIKAAESACLMISISSLEISNGNSISSGEENIRSKTFPVIE